MNRDLFRMLGVVVVALVCLTLSRCISAEEKDLVTYDAAKDEFRMLMVLQDIRAKDADDVDYLEGIYKNRDHLIAPVIPGAASLLPLVGMSAVRVSDTQASTINIFGSRPTSFDIATTAASLNAVKITPGTFFLQDKKLGYYQAVTVPGKTIDTVLAEISSAPKDDMVKGIDAELARRKDGGAVTTWAAVKEEALKTIVIKTKAEAANPPAEGTKSDPLSCMDIESLNNLKKALTDGTLKLTRQKQAVTVKFPLVAKDATEAADLAAQFLKRLDAVIAETKETPENADSLKMSKSIQVALRAFSATAGDGGLTMALDILKLADAANSLPVHRVDLNDDKNADPAAPKADPIDLVAAFKDRKVPLDETLTAEQVIKDWNAGTLKGHPSETPVKPGEGIIKAAEKPKE